MHGVHGYPFRRLDTSWKMKEGFLRVDRALGK